MSGSARVLANGAMMLQKMRQNSEVRFIRAHIVRLVQVDDAHHLYYYSGNSKETHENDSKFFEVDKDAAGMVRALIVRYPRYTSLKELAPNNFKVAEALAYELYDRGLLMTKQPL